MCAESNKPDQAGGGTAALSEALRSAVEKTFAAAAEPRDRAQGMLGDLSRLGQGPRQDLGRRGNEARVVSAAAASRMVEAVERVRLAGRDDLRRLTDRVVELEAELDRLGNRVQELESKSEVEG